MCFFYASTRSPPPPAKLINMYLTLGQLNHSSNIIAHIVIYCEWKCLNVLPLILPTCVNKSKPKKSVVSRSSQDAKHLFILKEGVDLHGMWCAYARVVADNTIGDQSAHQYHRYVEVLSLLPMFHILIVMSSFKILKVVPTLCRIEKKKESKEKRQLQRCHRYELWCCFILRSSKPICNLETCITRIRRPQRLLPPFEGKNHLGRL